MIDTRKLSCWIGPPADLSKLGLNIDPKPTLGDHITDAMASEFDMTFPGGEAEGLARLRKMVSGLTEHRGLMSVG